MITYPELFQRVPKAGQHNAAPFLTSRRNRDVSCGSLYHLHTLALGESYVAQRGYDEAYPLSAWP